MDDKKLDANDPANTTKAAAGPAEASSAQGGRPSRFDALNPEADRHAASDDAQVRGGEDARHVETPPMENEEPKPQEGNPSADEMTSNPRDDND